MYLIKLALNFVAIFLVTLALAQLYSYLKRRRQSTKTGEDLIEYPKIARVKIHPYCCNLCGKPLQHNELVVWAERKDGWQGKSSHADCLVFLRHPDGSVTRLNSSEKLRVNSNGGILDPLPVGALLLTEAEWDSWAPPKLEVEIPPDKRVIFKA